MLESASEKNSELYEFGPFRVDPGKEMLLRAGEPVPLTPKTFQVLLVLVRHSQELVTKDDLLKAVWPDTFVEEANLSRNIFMLRKALGESPKDHRYIVTVPGRGYRLAENVHLLPEQELSVVAAEHTKVEVQVVETRSWARFAVGAVLLLVVGFGAWRFFPRRKPILTAKDTVVVADFANSTGDRVFDGTMRQGLAVQLEQSPFLSLVSEQRIRQTLRMMDRPADTALTPELARDVCARTGSAAVLEGSIALVGSRYILGLRAKNCRTGDVLAEEQEQAAKKEDVLNALGVMTSRIRKRVGESLNTIEEHNTPLAVATTSSLEALEAYSAALKAHGSSGALASSALFKRATELDPHFAMAFAFLGRSYADLDASDLAAENLSRAWELREHASDREKFFITANYEVLQTGNLEQALQTCETWARTYPRDPLPHLIMSGFPNKVRGRYERAIAEASQAIALDPDFPIGYYNLAVNHAYLNQLEEAEAALRRGTARGLEIDEYLMLEYDLAFLKGDQAAMERVAARARERSGAENWIANKEAFALAYSGRLQEARNMTRRSVEEAQQAGQRERAGLWEAGSALREAFFGNVSEARKRAAAALALTKNRESEYGAAFGLALAGDTRGAQNLADDLQRRFPEDTAVRFSYLPSLRAQLALDRGDATGALQMLQSAEPYELGVARSVLFGALYPVYVRGSAYMAAGKGGEAAKEFEKVVQHRGIVVSDPMGAIALLQLARAYGLAGDAAKARAAYENFLRLWKDADPDIPVLRQATAEHTKLVSAPAAASQPTKKTSSEPHGSIVAANDSAAGDLHGDKRVAQE